jgi:hypothetical protein
MTVPYDLFNKMQEETKRGYSDYDYYTGVCTISSSDSKDIDNIIKKFKLKIEKMPKNYYNVS